MIDWFVLLAPLAVLPIVLILVFVGCTLDRYGIPPPVVALRLVDDFQTDVANIEVTFQFVPISGELLSHLIKKETVSWPNLGAGTVIDKSSEMNLYNAGEGNLHCTCVITKTAEKITVHHSQYYGGDADDSELIQFELYRDGETIKLLGLEFGGVDF